MIERFNNRCNPGETKLYAPDIKFNRAIGRWAGQKFHAQTGEPIDDRAYEEHLKEYMPGPADKKLLLDIIGNEKKWIAEKTARAIRWPPSAKCESRRSISSQHMTTTFSQPNSAVSR